MTNEEAIEFLKFQRGYYCDFKCEEQQAYTMAIKALETEKTDKWIPIKEGPPKKNGDYFCTIRVVTYYTQVNPDSDEHEEHSVHRYVKVLNYQDGFPYGYNVIAWMPLPEAYKEE